MLLDLWYEYPIPADIEKQRVIIRQLRKWIISLESRDIIKGFAFNHYYPNPSTLNIRFDSSEDKLETMRKELEQEVKKLLPDYVLQERLWDEGKSQEYVYKAYEFGSRCAFLFWDFVEKGRFPEEFASSYLRWSDSTHFELKPKIFTFQSCFSHGVMNSLDISKTPNEQWLHLAALIESTKSSNPQELYEWIKSQPSLFFTKKSE
ncbi:hypothetical protein KAU88_03600 [Candidatus Bathyarchaeota archaeon]|nr:hypothetical protein [Candidatus Bathyarchaeota archaeon]